MKEEEDYFDSEEFKDILSEYENCIETGMPILMDTDDLTDIAEYYYNNNNSDGASKVIEAALTLSPNAAAPLIFKAHIAIENNNIKAAEQYEQQIGDKEDIDCYVLHATLLLLNKKPEEAEAFLESKNIVSEENADYIHDIAQLFYDNGNYEYAFNWTQKLKYKDDDMSDLIAQLYFQQEKYDDCIRIYKYLLDKNPFNGLFWTSLSSAQFMKSNYSEAIESAEYAIAIDNKDKDALINKANSLFHIDNYKEALNYYKRYTRLAPNDITGYYLQGATYNAMSCFQDAVIVFDKAIEIGLKKQQESDDTENDDEEQSAFYSSINLRQVYEEKAVSLTFLGKNAEALKSLDQIKTLEGGIDTEVLILQGHILFKMKQVRRGEEKFKKALAITDNAKQTFLKIGISLVDNERFDEAYEVFETLFDIAPHDGSWTFGYAYMALCCKQLKYAREFIHYLKKASMLNPDETQEVLGYLFPEEIEPREYYNYIIRNFNDNKK